MKTKRRLALALCLLTALSCGLMSAPASAQQWPTKPLRIIVPFPAGQAADLIARIIADRLGPALGQQIVVDNRPGAGGVIGAELTAKAAPDGYTLGMAGNATMSIAPSLYAKLSYAPLRDFAPVTSMAAVPFVFCVNPASPVQSIQDLIALAKARPGEVNYGSSGNGATSHLVQALFAAMAGMDVTHVPYKGAVPSLTDLIGGRITFVAETTPAVLPHVKAGRLRGIGVSSAKRITFLPDIPSLDEQGVKGFDVFAWGGLVAPAGTPAHILDRLNRDVVKIVNMPEVQQRFYEMAIIPVGNSREQFAAFLKAELPQWAAAVKVSGAKVE